MMILLILILVINLVGFYVCFAGLGEICEKLGVFENED